MKLRKLKITSLFLLASIFSFAQVAVPNTETFSLQNVYDAVHDHTPATIGTLQSCFDNAISGYFNATYNNDSYAPANSMLRFRDYKPNINPCDYPLVSFDNNVEVNCPPITNYAITSESTAQTACFQWYNNPTCLKVGTGFTGRASSGTTIGTQIYSQSSPCQAITTTGWYIYFNTDFTVANIIHLSNGVIDVSYQCHP